MLISIKKLVAIVVLFGALSVTACDPVSFAGVEAVSLMGSDKTLVDHAVSYGSGKDCSTLRRERGQTYCVEDQAVVRPNIYCYRDLGGVTCYDRPDQSNTGKQLVDRNDHNRAK